MLAATKVKKSGGEKKLNRTTYKIFSVKRVTRKFLEVLRCRLAKQRQRNVPKKCEKLSCFSLIRPIVFFVVVVFVAVAAWLA